MGTVGGSIMMRHVLILGLVTAAVQTFKLDAPEQVAVCTLGSTLSIPTRLDTALYECGFYDMKESYGNKPEKFGRAGKGGKGKMLARAMVVRAKEVRAKEARAKEMVERNAQVTRRC